MADGGRLIALTEDRTYIKTYRYMVSFDSVVTTIIKSMPNSLSTNMKLILPVYWYLIWLLKHYLSQGHLLSAMHWTQISLLITDLISYLSQILFFTTYAGITPKELCIILLYLSHNIINYHIFYPLAFIYYKSPSCIRNLQIRLINPWTSHCSIYIAYDTHYILLM